MSKDTMTDSSIEESPMNNELIVEQPPIDSVDDQPEPLTIEQIEALLAAEMPEPEAPFLGDPDATWDYWSGLSNPSDGPSDDLVLARLRYRRDALLAACDWRVVADAPWDVAPWQAYRQALRDLPDATSDPRLADWPVQP